MPPKVASEADESSPPLPGFLAGQVELIRAQLEPGGAVDGASLLRYVDAGVLNVCEIAEVDFELMNRALALRAASERLAQAIDATRRGPDPEREEARARALRELAALEEVLAWAKPSATTRAMGAGW